MNGFITLHRQIINWQWYSNHNTTRLFLHLLLQANHKDGKWQGRIIRRGELITSLDRLMGETGLSQKQIRLCIENLESTNEIRKIKANRYTHIVIINYDIYQSKGNHKQQSHKGIEPQKVDSKGNEKATEKTLKGQSKGTERATNNNNKQLNNENNNTIICEKSKIDYQGLMDYWNDKAVKPFSKVLEITEGRKKHINARLKKYQVADIKKAMDKVFASSFCAGSGRDNWIAGFDFVISPKIVKILEGNYDNKELDESVKSKRDIETEKKYNYIKNNM